MELSVHGRLGSSGGSHRLDRERWSLVVEVGRARPSVAWLRSRRRDKVSRLEGGDEVVELRLLASGGTSDTHAVACSDGSGFGARPLHAIFSLALRTQPMRRSVMFWCSSSVVVVAVSRWICVTGGSSCVHY
jgi:hypothetical protein